MFMLPVVMAVVILMPAVSNGQFYAERLPQRDPRIVTAAAAAATAVPNEVTSWESSTATVASGENKLLRNSTKTMSQRSPPSSPSSTTNDEELFPTLANGHLGFTVFGDAIYMNGLYNGHRGLSHRARIANIANIRLGGQPFEDDAGFSGGNQPSPWTMDFETGTFCVDYRGPNNSFRVAQLIYPHQLYNRAIVNQFTIERLDGEGDIHIGIIQSITFPGSDDIAFNPTKTIFISPDAERQYQHNSVLLTSQKQTAANFGDEYSTTAATTVKVYQTCGTTVELEDPSHQHQQRHVCVLWNHVPEELTLKRSERTVSYKFIMTADESASLARQELTDAILTEDNELLRRHSDVWRVFWSDFDIRTEGNPTLERIIRASVFYLISNFPLGMTSSTRAYLFGGLSPTGLGRGGSNLNDYEGHSFWDTEIWMFPVVNLIEGRFAEMMVDYRFRRMEAAQQNAQAGGYRGVKYPWESASSGIEVTQPCCPEVAQFQHHITADISFALRQYFSATQDLVWLHNQGCRMAQAIAEFWASRISPDPVTGLFDIKEVMGPDEDHENVTNNAYTNVIAAYALYFGDLTKCLCSKDGDDDDDNGADSSNKTNLMDLDKNVAPPTSTTGSGNWSALARHIKLLYDTENDYHPQFEGYQMGTVIKQADTVLLGYPLQYPGMGAGTRSNDLRFYESVTRRSGPAMTWAMHAINHLDLGDPVKAYDNFERSYKNYVREPFYVWNEVEQGLNGATNFITGAGGFLQAMMNGFGGIRLFLDRLEIRNPKLPPESTQFMIKGLHYVGAKLTLDISSNMTTIKFTKLTRDLTLSKGSSTSVSVVLNQTYDITNMTVVIKTKENIYTHCAIPEEVITTYCIRGK